MNTNTTNHLGVWFLSLSFALIITGCATQPPLHIAGPTNARDPNTVLDADTVKNARLNGFALVDTNMVATNASESVVANTNKDTQVSAYLQIMADADARQEFGETFSRCFFVGEVVVENKNTNNAFLAYSSTMQVNINYLLSQSDWEKLKKVGQSPGALPGVRRPSTYSDILAVFEYQRQSNWKQQVYNYLLSAGEIATGAGTFVNTLAYHKAVSFATGIILPEVQKRLLWDILLHAKNLEARSFKEIEEVPACGAIHRIVFFPKNGIPGIVGGKLVYINSFKQREITYVAGSLITKNQTTATATVKSP